jgi:hypothetical protein
VVQRIVLPLIVLGTCAASGLLATTTFAQTPPSGPTASDIRSLMMNPLYRYRSSHQVQTGVNPLQQQQTLLQQQAALEQQRAQEKTQKREADRARKTAAVKERRAKELQLREQKKQENLAARGETPAKDKSSAKE